MPAGDRTGPRGEGPLTGRGAGTCGEYPAGSRTAVPGRGGSNGFFSGRGGGGRGRRNRYYETGLPLWQRDLQDRKPYLRQQLSETEELKRQVQSTAAAIDRITLRVSQLLNRNNDKD